MFEDSRELISAQTNNFDGGMSSCKSGTGEARHSSNGASELNGDYLPPIESYSTRLFNLLDDLKSLSDRACVAALRKAESADDQEESMFSAIITLRNQLDERDEDLQAKDEALKRLDTRWRAKFEQLEICMRKKDAQLRTGGSDLQLAGPEAQELSTRLNYAELALQNSECQRKQLTERFQVEIAALKLQLLSRTARLEEKEISLRKAEGELRARVEDHRISLQEIEAKLAAVETELEQKKSVLEAAALRESEIRKLMGRLSLECEHLTGELHDKLALITRLEEKNHDHPTGGKVWKRVIGLMQQQPL
jgi:chromosome segregation ATPase